MQEKADPESQGLTTPAAIVETGLRLGPKGILGLLCAISLLVFADRGTTLCFRLVWLPTDQLLHLLDHQCFWIWQESSAATV